MPLRPRERPLGKPLGLSHRRRWDEIVVGFIPSLRKLARVECVFRQAHSRKMHVNWKKRGVEGVGGQRLVQIPLTEGRTLTPRSCPSPEGKTSY